MTDADEFDFNVPTYVHCLAKSISIFTKLREKNSAVTIEPKMFIVIDLGLGLLWLACTQTLDYHWP